MTCMQSRYMSAIDFINLGLIIELLEDYCENTHIVANF